jgi:hypothetical protein
MREQPWHIRRITSHHAQWYERLIDAQQLTSAWTGKTQCKSSLESLLDDTAPDDLLLRLEEDILGTQYAVLEEILTDSALKSEKKTSRLLHDLHEQSFDTGLACAKKRWPDLTNKTSENLRSVFVALNSSLWKPQENLALFIAKRLTQHELALEWIGCPHSNPYIKNRTHVDTLCELYVKWIQGFVSAFNSKVSISHHRNERCCQQLWTRPR